MTLNIREKPITDAEQMQPMRYRMTLLETIRIAIDVLAGHSNLPDDLNKPSKELNMGTIIKNIEKVEETSSRNDLIVGCVYGFLILFLFCIGTVLVRFKPYEQSSAEPEKTDSICRKRLIGYYSGWDKRTISEQQIEKLTHIIFDGMKLKEDGNVDFESDEHKLLFLHMKNRTRSLKSNVPIMFSTDAYADNLEHLSNILSESESRKNLINSILSFLLEQQLDGVELHYRWPESKKDKDNYMTFVNQLRNELGYMEQITLRPDPYIISILTPPSNWAWKEETIIEELLNSVDFFNVETENYYGPWHKNGMTGPLSPLFSNTYNQSIDWTMEAYTCKTRKPSRFNFIVPFRGAYFRNVKYSYSSNDDLYRSFDKFKGKDNGTPAAWRYLKKFGFKLSNTLWHNDTKTPFIWDFDERILYTFDNERSLVEKVKYAVSKNLGGIAIRRLEYDDDETTLWNAVKSIDLCSGPRLGKDEVKYNCEHVETSSTAFNLTIFLLFFIFLLCCLFCLELWALVENDGRMGKSCTQEKLWAQLVSIVEKIEYSTKFGPGVHSCEKSAGLSRPWTVT